MPPSCLGAITVVLNRLAEQPPATLRAGRVIENGAETERVVSVSVKPMFVCRSKLVNWSDKTGAQVAKISKAAPSGMFRLSRA